MAIIYFREAEVEGETEERRQYERAGMDLFEGSLALWAEETSCAPPDGQDVDYVWDHGAELLGAFDDAIANGADPAPLRGYYLAGWVQCVEMIGTDALAATNIDVATNGMPCGWGSE